MADPSPLFYRSADTGPAPAGLRPLLVLLHGRGTDENDLLGLAPLLDPRFHIISVRAPRRMTGGGFTWYDLHEIGRPDTAQLVESHGLLCRFLETLPSELPVDPMRIFLFGFSMGAMMSFTLALTHPERIRGVVAHSGYIPETTPLSYRWGDLGQTAFFVAHGTEDPIVPVAMGRRSAELLRPTGAPLEYREYPIPHTISEESLDDSNQWLGGRLDGR